MFSKPERGKVEIKDLTKQLKDFSFSATSLSEFLTCPRKFLYDNIVDSQDAGNKSMGIYLHQYAEFRTSFPDEAKKRGREFFVRYVTDRCLPLFPPEIRKLQESKIRFAIAQLDDLIEGNGMSEGVELIKREQKYPNPLFEMVGKKDYCSDRNEVVMIERDRHMYGKMDLVIGSHIYDFKTGRAKDPESMKKLFKQSKNSKYGTDIQCLFYLSLIEDNGIKDPTLTLFSTSANESNLSSGLPMDYDIAMTHIKLVDDLTVMREYLPDEKSMNKGKKYDEIRDRWDEFIDALIEIGLERALADPAGVAQEFYDRMNMRATSPKKPKEALDAFERTMINANKALDSGSLIRDNTLIVTSRQMEAFREKVKESYDAVQAYYGTIFPMIPMMVCKNCDCKDMCTELKADGDDDE